MDKLERDRDLIEKILTAYYSWASNASSDGVEECCAFDRVRDRYFWFAPDCVVIDW